MSRTAIVSGGNIVNTAPSGRVKKLAKAAPFGFPAYSPAPSVVSATGQAGTLVGGTVLRGTNPGNVANMGHLAMPGTSGEGVIGTNLLEKVYGYDSENWSSANSETFGTDTIQIYTHIRSRFLLSFETNAPVFGVCFANIGSIVRVWIDKLDGAGFKEAAPLNPYPRNLTKAIIYFDLAGDTATKRIIVSCEQAFGSLVVRRQDSFAPYDARKQFLKVATFGDSIGYVLNRVVTAVGGIMQVSHGDGSTGYGTPGGSKIGGGSPTSNADYDFAVSPTAMSGNHGYNDGTRTEFQYTNRTDALIAGKPDIIIGAHGINDSTATDVNGYGWSISRSVAKVWQRLRDGCGASILVCCAPWTGAQRGVSGLDGGERFVAVTIKTEFLRISGPSIFIDNRDSSWTVKRADGTLVSGSTGSGVWVTGIGTVQAPTGVGNADLYVGDGTHPGGWASTTLSADVTLPVATLPVVASSGGVANFPPVGKVSIQSAGAVAYPGQVVTYTGKGAGTLTGCTGGAGTFLAGSQVLMYETVPGEDYYGNKVAAALCDALAVL